LMALRTTSTSRSLICMRCSIVTLISHNRQDSLKGGFIGTEYMAYGVTDLFGFEAVFSPAVLLDSTNGLIQLQS